MDKVKEDLSGPYESWATARLDVAHARTRHRIAPMLLVILGGVLTVAVLNVWVIISNVLHPLWSKPPEVVLFSLTTSFLVGTVVLGFTSKFGRMQAFAMLFAFCLMLPIGVMTLAPLFLYVNQVGDLSDTSCGRYALLKKAVLKGKGYAYELTLSDGATKETRLRVHPKLYHELHEGRNLWIELGSGLFGVRYVKQISDMALPDCGERELLAR